MDLQRLAKYLLVGVGAFAVLAVFNLVFTGSIGWGFNVLCACFVVGCMAVRDYLGGNQKKAKGNKKGGKKGSRKRRR